MTVSELTPLTPMLRQYLDVKAQHPDAIVLYRMGDFYELFYEDARTAAPVLEVTLTARNKGTENEAPMCGVPYHALQTYLAKLLRAGYKVAICDQVEDPRQAKGLVKREVTRVVTPGTLSEPDLLDAKEENLLAALVFGRDEAGAGAFLDLSTGTFFARRWVDAEEARDDLEVLRPREVLWDEALVPAPVRAWVSEQVACRSSAGDGDLGPAAAADLLRRQFGVASLRGFSLADEEPAVRAAAVALRYAHDTQRNALGHLRTIAVRGRGDAMVLDPATVGNLEIFRNPRDGGRAHTLIGVVDRTLSAPGARCLRDWLRRPLTDPAAIAARQDAVAALVAAPERRRLLREALERLGDPERLLTRAVLGTLTPREAGALRDGLGAARDALAKLAGPGDGLSPRLHELGGTDPLPDLSGVLDRTLEPSPPASFADGGVIRAGVDPELDVCRELARDSKRVILALEVAERERTGIASLKIRYNKVFGYYLEITRAQQAKVPPEYIRKQTLVNAERYVTPEIKELEERILGAEERQLALESALFERLRGEIVAAGAGLSALGRALGEVDALAGLAELAARGGWVRPVVGERGAAIRIREGRHPVVERTVSGGFVPNDAELDAGGAQVVVLTGPNMGGKSTYLRQVALLVILAQIGSFVPAQSAELGVVDRVFTRIGASDDLARGESTFMVEMIETANILRHAGPASLVVLDEVGRGTSTFDGLSLAWAIVEELHRLEAKTLFATHYHELTEIADHLPRVVNRTMAVREWEDKIAFLRRVVPGSADRSYGLQVARLAGIPETVVKRAAEVLANLESQQYDARGRPKLARSEDAIAGVEPPPARAQMALFAPPEEMVAAILREVDIGQLTPLAALNLLHSLQARLKGGE